MNEITTTKMKQMKLYGMHNAFKTAIESRNHPEQAYKSCLGILNFEKKVGKQRLINACKRALDFRIYSFKAIQNILENNLDNAENEQEEEFELPNHNNIRGKNYYK